MEKSSEDRKRGQTTFLHRHIRGLSSTSPLSRFALRDRFLVAFLLLSALLLGVFALGIKHFLDIIEVEFIGAEFRSEYQRLLSDYRDREKFSLPFPPGFTAFVAASANDAHLDATLRALPAGVHERVTDGRRVLSVAKTAVDGGMLYVVFDQAHDPVVRLQRRLLGIALWVGLIALLLDLGLALWLSQVVMRPVERLARNIAAIAPGRHREPLLTPNDQQEIAVIARAFDATLARFDEFAERERAFTRDASHELRTPLAVIASGMQLMDSDPNLAPEQRTRLARAQAAAAQMQALVEGLLFLSRGEELGRATAAFSVGGLLHEAVRTLTIAAGRRAPALSVSITRDCEVSVPRGLLLCVVNNLLRNALDHSQSRRIDVELDAPRLVIQDYGRGIEEHAQEQVFEPDRRGPDSQGEGVGLNLVKRICDRLGWRIALESAPGAGARFTLELS